MNQIPFRQSDIDGLCGFMAILNAMKYLYSTDFMFHDSIGSFLLKKNLVSIISNFNDIWNNGMTNNQIFELLQYTKLILDDVDKHIEIFHMKPMEVFIDSGNKLWNILKEVLTDENVCVIIGMYKPDSHWTVGTHIKGNVLYLMDSGPSVLKKIKKEDVEFEVEDLFLIRKI